MRGVRLRAGRKGDRGQDRRQDGGGVLRRVRAEVEGGARLRGRAQPELTLRVRSDEGGMRAPSRRGAQAASSRHHTAGTRLSQEDQAGHLSCTAIAHRRVRTGESRFPMRMVEEEVGKGVSILIFGPWRAPVGGRARREVEEALARGTRSFVIDLAHVSAIDAAGLGELVSLYTLVLAEGGVLRAANANAKVGKLLEVAGLRWLSCGFCIEQRLDGSRAGNGSSVMAS